MSIDAITDEIKKIEKEIEVKIDTLKEDLEKIQGEIDSLKIMLKKIETLEALLPHQKYNPNPVVYIKEKFYDANRWIYGLNISYKRNGSLEIPFSSYVHWNEVSLKDCKIADQFYTELFKAYFDVKSDDEEVKITKDFVLLVQILEHGHYKRLSIEKFREYFGNGKIIVEAYGKVMIKDKSRKQKLAELALEKLGF